MGPNPIAAAALPAGDAGHRRRGKPGEPHRAQHPCECSGLSSHVLFQSIRTKGNASLHDAKSSRRGTSHSNGLPKFNSHVGIERHETNDTEVAAIRVARPGAGSCWSSPTYARWALSSRRPPTRRPRVYVNTSESRCFRIRIRCSEQHLDWRPNCEAEFAIRSPLVDSDLGKSV